MSVLVLLTALMPLSVLAKQFRLEGPLSMITVTKAGGSPGNQVNYVKPQWSPDGSALTFETLARRERRLHVHVFADGVSHELRSRRENRSATGGRRMPTASALANFDATWSSRGDMVAYVGSGALGYFGLYIVDAGNWGKFTSFVAGSEGDPYVAFPAFHPSRDLVVFSQGEEQARLSKEGKLDLHWASPLRPGRPGALLAPGVGDGIPQLEPMFSPNGRQLAFTGIKSGNNDIYSVNLAVTRHTVGQQADIPLRRLTDWPTPEGRPTWSPDGSRLAFLSGHEESKEEWGLWVVSADGTGNPQKIQGRVLAQDHPEWYDDRHLFVVRVAEELNNPIIYADLQTGEVDTLQLPTVLHTHIAISPDGRRIALCARGKQGDGNLTWLKLYVGTLVATD